MIFAAGFGTRMKPLTDHMPKPLIKVAGVPLIDHALSVARAATKGTIVVNTHYKPDMLEAHLVQQDVTIIREAPDILDTGGGLRNALPRLGHAPVITMNSDMIWDGPNPITLLRAAWNPDRMDALLMCIPVAQTRAYAGEGDFDLGDDCAVSRGRSHVYGGVQILRTDDLLHVDEKAFSLNVVWNRMAEQGRLFGLSYTGLWCDVGHPDGIAVAEAMLRDV